MRQKLITYLQRTKEFSQPNCVRIADEICSLHYPHNVGRVQDILLKYIGGEDDYGYETSYEMARRIVRLMR